MPTLPLHFSYTGLASTAEILDSTYPSGAYLFFKSSQGSLPYPLNFPSSLSQPNAPHISNFTAAQHINPNQPFTLSWDSFVGGTAADTITLEIYGVVYNTPGLGEPGALNGTATATVIPAGTLEANRIYQGAITFYHATMVTNSSLWLTYRSSVTEFTLSTFANTPASPITLTNAMRSSGALTFEVVSSPGQNLTVECNTDFQAAGWKTLLVTNSATGRFLFKDSDPMTNRCRFYRARTAP